MPDDPITLLERELVDAARRRAVVADDRAGSGEPRGPWPMPGPVRRRSSLGAFAAVVLAGVTVAVALGALLSLRGHEPPARTVSARPATVPGRLQLIVILGVLRRPQTEADVDSPGIARFLGRGGQLPGPFGRVDLPLVRRATLTPWGSGVFLIPVKPSVRSRGAEAVALFVDSGGGCCATATGIERYGDMTTEGAGRSFAGRSTQTRVTTLVPDGVASVEFVLPRQPNPSDPGAPIYRSVKTVTATVHDNVAAVQVDRECCAGNTAIIWRAADGHVIKRIGNPDGADRVEPTPQPGPETPLSRAAERDPSTPNRVWVTPSVGGPHTMFMVHFPVLLNGAEYRYQLSGTRCPAITLNGGGGGGTQDLRGRIWSDQVAAVAGQTWCPGAYHLSVSIASGRPGAAPFGTATFTVKP